jgi:hypothetical protein
MKNDEKLARAARGSDIGHMLTMDYEGKVDKLVAHILELIEDPGSDFCLIHWDYEVPAESVAAGDATVSDIAAKFCAKVEKPIIEGLSSRLSRLQYELIGRIAVYAEEVKEIAAEEVKEKAT